MRCLSRASSTSLRSEEHTSELQSQSNLVCRLLLEKKNISTAMKSPTRSVVVSLLVTFLAVAGLGVVHGLGGSQHLAGQFVHHAPRSNSHKHADCILQKFAITATSAKFQNPSGSRAITLARAHRNGIVRAPRLFFLKIQLPPTSTLFPYTTLFR